MPSSPTPTALVLMILDGWGASDIEEGNAIACAETPTWDHCLKTYPHTTIDGSGLAVGLPAEQMGNSEVGHLHIGAGRLLEQNLVRLNNAIADGSFFTNPALTQAIDLAISHNKAVHIIGLLSDGGVHSHQQHLIAAAELAAKRGLEAIHIHAILDGRDTAPRAAATSIKVMNDALSVLQSGHISSIIGRYYAMDRDKRWPRTQIAYDMLTTGTSPFHAETAEAALKMAYGRGETDEFVQATLIEPRARIADGDVVLFMNFRADRARQLTRAFTETDFDGFKRKATPQLGDFVTLTQYAHDIKAQVAFAPEVLDHTLGACVSEAGLQQLRIAETEKYAHVTYFFNGGREAPFDGETRRLIPSPKVATYDLQPEMSAPELTQQLVAAIMSQQYSLIVCNYANPDMVGHTGIFSAAITAVETIDACLAQVIAALAKTGGELLLTADHGNVEQMLDPETGQPQTAHSNLPVPLVYVGRDATLKAGGSLTDIAPTVLHLLSLPQPHAMTGHNLVSFY